MGKFIDKFKDYLGKDEDEENVYDEYEDEEIEEDDYEDEYEDYEEKSPIDNVINMDHQMKVVIYAPKEYADVMSIADSLKRRKTVVVNLEAIKVANEKKSIIDFIGGVVYVLEGSVQKVASSIFILAPKNVDINSNIKKELENKVKFPWYGK